MASNDFLIKQRSVIEFLTTEGCSAANIYDRMKSVFGNMRISDSAVRKWVRYFRGEDPAETNVRDSKRPGRLLSASDTNHQEAVDCMIRSNGGVKQSVIANEVGISRERVHHIVTHLLGYRKVSAQWVPRQLTLEIKTQRKEMCIHLLKRYNKEGEAFLEKVVTRDESWVHHFDQESKVQSMEYRHKTSPSPRKFKVIASARKVLLTIFWDMKGVVHMEFLKQGHTVNSEKYISTLRTLKARLRRVRSGRNSILQHDNGHPHTSRQTQNALAQLKLPALPHPAYSPNLALSDYFLFLQLKKHLKGNHFDSDEEVVATVPQWCREQSPEFFADGIRQLV